MAESPSRVRFKPESMLERLARVIRNVRIAQERAKAAKEGVALTDEGWWVNPPSEEYCGQARAVITTIRDALPHGISRTILDQALEDD